MMITNIVDRRSNAYKSTELDFVVEPSSTDNDIKGAQFHDPGDNATGLMYEEMRHSTISEAIIWANKFDSPVTLYIYDDLNKRDADTSLFEKELNADLYDKD